MEVRQPLTRAVFDTGRFPLMQFQENADTLLRQLTQLGEKPVCRFVVPPLDHDDRKKLLAELCRNNWMLTLQDAFIVHEDIPFHYTHVEVIAVSA